MSDFSAGWLTDRYATPSPEAHTRRDVEHGLRTRGMGRGNVVGVHSSLSSLGRVEEGIAIVVDAPMNVAGEQGAILMPRQALAPPSPLTEDDRTSGIQKQVGHFPPKAPRRTGVGASPDEFGSRVGTDGGDRGFQFPLVDLAFKRHLSCAFLRFWLPVLPCCALSSAAAMVSQLPDGLFSGQDAYC
jgi:hypothetical protein